MPIGANLQINFDTTSTAGKHTYPFTAEDEPTPLILGEFDAYHGGYGSSEIGVTASLEGDAYHGGYGELLSIQVPAILDADAYHGSYGDLELDRFRLLGARYDLPLCCPYETPWICDVDFELGADEVISFGDDGITAGYDFNLITADAIDTNDHDINWSSGLNVDKKYSCTEQFHVIDCKQLEVELTTDPVIRNENDFDLCHFSVSQGNVKPAFVDLNLEGSGDTELNVEKRFETFEWEYHYGRETDCIDIPLEFNIQNGQSATFEIEVEKNLEWDLKLCPDEQNLPLDYSELEPHNFEFQLDYDYECAQFTFDFYHGQYADAFLTTDIRFGDTLGYHGAYADADFTITQNFDGDAYHGAYSDADLTDNPAPELDGDAYHGSYADCDFSTILNLTDIDAYHGAYGDADLTDNPAAELDGDAYHGSYGELELATFAVLDADAYHGAYGDTDFTDNPVDLLDGDAYHGSYADADFSTFSLLEGDAYHGAYADTDFTDFPAAELEPIAYHGSYGELDVFVTPGFIPTAYHGSYGEADLEIVLGEGFGDVDAYHGSYGDLEIAPTFALYPEAYHGSYGDLGLATTIQFGDTLGYHGAYGDTDLTVPPPPTPEPNADHGSYAVVNSMSVTKALFPRGYAGEYADCDFTNNPVDEFEIDNYHGSVVELDTLAEDAFIFRAYHGSYADTTMNVTVAMEADAYHGSYAEFDDLNIDFVSLPADAYHGIRAIVTGVGFEVPVAPSMEADAYHGQTFEAETDIRIHALMEVEFVHGYALYDGFGGVGGLNHCISQNLDPVHGDTVVRFDFPLDGDFGVYDDHIITSFDETGFRPWNPCNESHGMGHMEIDLLTNQRFEFDCYHGNNTQIFSEKELQPLCGDVPDLVLYSENGSGNRHDHVDLIQKERIFEFDFYAGESGLVWWEGSESVLSFVGNTVQFGLSEEPIWQSIGNGEVVYCVLSGEEPNWFQCMGQFTHSSSVAIDFNPEIWFRFCPGYVLPIGNNVILEFGIEDNTDCFAYFASTGEDAIFELSALPHPEPRAYAGERIVDVVFTVDKPWDVWGRHGHHVDFELSTSDSFQFTSVSDGSVVTFEFFDPPWEGAHGSHASVEAFEVPIGFSVEWVTDEGCLPNDYIPLTEGGDPDLIAILPDEHGVHFYPDVPVELLPYRKQLEAVCITFVEEG